jgi:hypothetical protein
VQKHATITITLNTRLPLVLADFYEALKDRRWENALEGPSIPLQRKHHTQRPQGLHIHLRCL